MDSNLFQSAFLGFIQGMSEFLPVSSTAHLILAPYFFGWKDLGLTFDVALHIGTLLAVVSYFWRDWLELIVSAFGEKKDAKSQYPKYFLWYLVVATIPAGVAGYFFENIIKESFRNPLAVAFFLVVFGFLLYRSDRNTRNQKSLETASYGEICIIGLAQALAIIPGVSRSGVTITMGRFLGFGRDQAARISFLLSTPIILGAALSQLSDIRNAGLSPELIVGIIVSAISGYIAIAYLLQLIARIGYAMFFWYRLFLAAMIVVFYFIS